MSQTRITLEILEKADACSEQRDDFERLFPNGVEVTRELCIEHAQVFDWTWAEEELLTDTARQLYAVANAVATETFDEAYRVANVAFNTLCATVRHEHDAEAQRVRNEAYCAHDIALHAVRSAFNSAKAVAWADAFLSDANEGWDAEL